MKKNDFFSELNRELDGLDLPMSERLKAEPISVDRSTEEKRRKPLRRRYIPAIAGGLAASVALVCILASLPPAAETETAACMRIDINPSVTFLLDGKGKVFSVVSLNSDGDTLVRDEAFVEDLVSLSAAEAAKKMAERAAKTGYLDLYANGSDGEYNEIEVCFEGVNALPQVEEEEVKNALVSFFKEKGVYVYVTASKAVFEGGKSAFEELQKRPVSFFEYAKTQSGEEGARTAAENAVLEYTKDILVSSFEKYELFQKIDANNALIEERTETFFGNGKNYWGLSSAEREDGELRELVLQTKELLEKLYALGGEDYRSVGLISGAVSAAAFEAHAALYLEPLADEIAALSVYASGTVSVREFTVNDVVDFATLAAASGYSEEILGSLQSMLSFVLSDVVAETEELVECAESFLMDWSTELYEKYSVLFEESRTAISDSEYEQFLKKIQKN